MSRGVVRSRVVVLAVSTWAVALAGSADRASAAGTCSFDPVGGAVSATVASLGTVSVSGSEIRVDGAPCVSPDGRIATTSSTSAIVLTASPGDDVVRVDLTGGTFADIAWTVDLGEGSDTFAIRGSDGRDVLTVGGAGFSLGASGGSLSSVEAFVLRGLAGSDVLSAAGGTPGTGGLVSGSVTIVGGPGHDRMHGGLGADAFRGGPGGDLVTYLSHGTSITATLDGLPNDGMAGEDRVRGDVENLMGGTGDDRLVGNAGANRLAGAPGSDVIEGGDGRDRIRGEQDDDRLDGGPGDDLLRGGFGQDLVEGGDGHDTLDGGGHPDLLRGGRGDDVVLAADGWVDSVNCGPGEDAARVDVIDAVSGCETVEVVPTSVAGRPYTCWTTAYGGALASTWASTAQGKRADVAACVDKQVAPTQAPIPNTRSLPN